MGEPERIHPVRPRLGRGLSSLISSLTGTPLQDSRYSPEADATRGAKSPLAVPIHGSPQVAEDIPVEQIGPNPFQPRREFPSQELADLSASIARHGVLQPIRVTKAHDPASACPYTLVAGERRLRAAKMAGRKTIPSVVGEATQEQMLEWAVIENIHRSDLNPIERGEAYLQFVNRFGVSQADLAETLGEPRTTISNYLRILDLHPDIRSMVSSARLSFGHAKVLAGLVGREAIQLELARRAEADGLSVREVESLVARAADGTASDAPQPRAIPARPAYIRDLEERLSAAVGTRVWVRPGRAKNTGKVVIEYDGLDEFDRISRMLGVPGE
jgi:ParB family transcriptional regulator, chromosome partitioning protein